MADMDLYFQGSYPLCASVQTVCFICIYILLLLYYSYLINVSLCTFPLHIHVQDVQSYSKSDLPDLTPFL